MKVVVDRQLCQGHGMCEDTTSEVFRVVEAEDGTYSLVEILIPEPGAELEEKVEEAVRYCPNRALSIQR